MALHRLAEILLGEALRLQDKQNSPAGAAPAIPSRRGDAHSIYKSDDMEGESALLKYLRQL